MTTTTLRELDPGHLWVAEEPSDFLGVPIGARSTIVRLGDGGLWVHSPVSPTTELRRELDSLGPVRCIVAPTCAHTVYPADWATLYPEARVFVSPRWAKSLPSPPQVLGEDAPELWSADLEQALFLGNVLIDEVAFFHARSETLIVCDLLFNLPEDMAPARKLLARTAGLPFRPASSRLERAMTKDNKAARASLERMLAWHFERIILSHGQIVESGGREALRTGFGWLWQN